MKNLKINLKKFLMRNMLALALITTPMSLTGCGKDNKAEDEQETIFVWADHKGVIAYQDDLKNEEEVRAIHYLDSTRNLCIAYIDTQHMDELVCTDLNGVTIYDTVDEKMLDKFIRRNDLISIPDNLDELIEATKDNNITVGYEYINDGDERVYNGKAYLNLHYYQTYKIIINEDGKCELVDGPILFHIEDWNEEYPYLKEDYDKTFAYDISNLGFDEQKLSNKAKQNKPNKRKINVPE